MTAPGNDILLSVLLIAFTASTGYAAGRIHQWYRTALERDQAYRDGYDTATRSLFGLAARFVRPRRSERGEVRGTATVTSILAAPSGAHTGGRHTAPESLVEGPTYRLTPERLAQVRQETGAARPGPIEDETTSIAVRKLRAS
jgi:hypothetical protein